MVALCPTIRQLISCNRESLVSLQLSRPSSACARSSLRLTRLGPEMSTHRASEPDVSSETLPGLSLPSLLPSLPVSQERPGSGLSATIEKYSPKGSAQDELRLPTKPVPPKDFSMKLSPRLDPLEVPSKSKLPLNKNPIAINRPKPPSDDSQSSKG